MRIYILLRGDNLQPLAFSTLKRARDYVRHRYPFVTRWVRASTGPKERAWLGDTGGWIVSTVLNAHADEDEAATARNRDRAHTRILRFRRPTTPARSPRRATYT